MKRIFNNTIVRLLIAVAAGILTGMFIGDIPLSVVMAIKHICGQLIFFLVPLIIIGFIAPSIAHLRNNASKMLLFAFVIAYLSSVGAPGVPGGTVLASLGLIVSVLHFDEAGTALLLTIFALQDSFGTACNVTGDGALTLMTDAFEKRNTH